MGDWESIFKKKGKFFHEPHEDMRKFAQLMKKNRVKKVLDLGCGSGRHTVFFAKLGFDVYGMDSSKSGLKQTRDWLKQSNLQVKLKNASCHEKFPYKDDSFDAIISVQVIHHADIATIKKIIAEIERILKKGGFIFVTVPKLKNQATKYKEIEPNTYVLLDGWEKGLPHHYFTPEELKDFFSNFEVVDVHLDQINHYCLSAFKL